MNELLVTDGRLTVKEPGQDVEVDDDNHVNVIDNSPERELDIWGWELLKQKPFWLLFFSMAIEDGAAVFFSNALGFMRDALDADNAADGIPAVSTLIIIFATCNAVGRFTWGFLSDKYRQNRSMILMCTMVGMMLGHLIMATKPTLLLVATVVVGFNFGGMFACAPVITGEYFGHKHLGTNWGFVVIAPAIGSVAFGVLFGTWRRDGAFYICFLHLLFTAACKSCVSHICFLHLLARAAFPTSAFLLPLVRAAFPTSAFYCRLQELRFPHLPFVRAAFPTSAKCDSYSSAHTTSRINMRPMHGLSYRHVFHTMRLSWHDLWFVCGYVLTVWTHRPTIQRTHRAWVHQMCRY